MFQLSLLIQSPKVDYFRCHFSLSMSAHTFQISLSDSLHFFLLFLFTSFSISMFVSDVSLLCQFLSVSVRIVVFVHPSAFFFTSHFVSFMTCFPTILSFICLCLDPFPPLSMSLFLPLSFSVCFLSLSHFTCLFFVSFHESLSVIVSFHLLFLCLSLSLCLLTSSHFTHTHTHTLTACISLWTMSYYRSFIIKLYTGKNTLGLFSPCLFLSLSVSVCFSLFMPLSVLEVSYCLFQSIFLYFLS